MATLKKTQTAQKVTYVVTPDLTANPPIYPATIVVWKEVQYHIEFIAPFTSVLGGAPLTSWQNVVSQIEAGNILT